MKKLIEELKIRSIEDALFFGSMTILAVLKKRIAQQELFANKLRELLKVPSTSDIELKSTNKNLVVINKEIKALNSLILEARCKPPLVPYREDWFTMNEEVICFIDGEFVPAKIYNNRDTYKDGTVALAVVYGRRVRPDGFFSGYGDMYSISDPRIMKKWEYEYFCQHFRFAKKWAIMAEEKDSGFNSFEFMTKIFAISCAKGYMKWKI